MLPILHYQARCKRGSPQGKRKGRQGSPRTKEHNEGKSRSRLHSRSKERERESERAEASQQATKKGTPPPIDREQAAVPLITNSRQKISKKSLGVDLKKFSEKFFGGMFRGKEKPLAFLNGRGVATNSIKL